MGLLLLILVIEVIILAPNEIGIRNQATLDSENTDSDSESEAELDKNIPPINGTQMMGDFHLVLSRGEKGEGEVWGQKATRKDSDSPWIITQVHIKFFAENGGMYDVTGDEGTVQSGPKSENSVKVKGHVVTRSSNGYTLKTSALDYLPDVRQLTSPGAVDVLGPMDENHHALSVQGEQMLADLKSNEIQIKKNVKAKKMVRDQKMAHIKSNQAQFSGTTNAVKFFGNVVIDVGSMKITGPEADFNYKPNSDVIDQMLVKGGARVSDLDKLAISDQVSVHFDDDRYEFTGSPRVIQNGDELVGDEISFLNGGKQVRVRNAKAKIESNHLNKNNTTR